MIHRRATPPENRRNLPIEGIPYDVTPQPENPQRTPVSPTGSS